MKELELEAEKYKNQKGSISTTELEDAIFKQGFIDGATSKYVEKQKLKFAIEQLKSISLGLSDATVTVYNLLQKLKNLNKN